VAKTFANQGVHRFLVATGHKPYLVSFSCDSNFITQQV